MLGETDADEALDCDEGPDEGRRRPSAGVPLRLATCAWPAQPSHWHPEGRTTYVAEPGLVESMDRLRVTTVLTTELGFRSAGLPPPRQRCTQPAHAIRMMVSGEARKMPFPRYSEEEGRPTSSRLKPQTICVRSLVPKEKNSAASAISRARERRAAEFDHRADQVMCTRSAPRPGPVDRLVDLLRRISAQLITEPTSGTMISAVTAPPFVATMAAASDGRGPASGTGAGSRPRRTRAGRASGSARAGGAQPRAGCRRAPLTSPLALPVGATLTDRSVKARQELVQRRVEQADGHGETIHPRRS